jgi:transmembrane sensor
MKMHLNMEMEYKDEYIKALLVEKLAGTISEKDELIVNHALADSPEAFAYWEYIRQKLKSSSAPAFLEAINEDAAWGRVNNRMTAINAGQEKTVARWRFTFWHYGMGAAAMLILSFGGFWLTNSQKPSSPTLTFDKQVHLKTDDGEAIDLSADRKFSIEGAEINNHSKELSYATSDKKPLQWATLVVPPAKDYKIKLDDGTSVWLNAASSLRFPFRFDRSIREVYLSGEAYFEVSKNAKVPFLVHTDYADIHVHGTSFNVNAYEKETFSTALVEGSVSAVNNNKTIKLQPGEEVFAGTGKLSVRNFAPELLSWRNGTYHFHRRSLNEIAQVLGRWYDVKVVWKSTAISTQTFTGEIDKRQPLTVVLSNLQLTSGIKSELEKGILTFY